MLKRFKMSTRDFAFSAVIIATIVEFFVSIIALFIAVFAFILTTKEAFWIFLKFEIAITCVAIILIILIVLIYAAVNKIRK